jgi:spore coat polysaccharide biosynthesis protein SpsF
MTGYSLVLACRIGSTRLFGKPLQLIDVEQEITILDNIIKAVAELRQLDQIILAVSSLPGNEAFHEFGKKRKVRVISGDDEDMLGRLIAAGNVVNAETILHVSSESPFVYTDNIDAVGEKHISGSYDFSKTDLLPDGAGYAFYSMEALRRSHNSGDRRHRSELVSLFIHENEEKFKIYTELPPEELRRPDVRITVDYPEDLIFCRRLYNELDGADGNLTISKIVDFWNQNPEARRDVENIGIDWGRGRLWN